MEFEVSQKGEQNFHILNIFLHMLLQNPQIVNGRVGIEAFS